MKEPDLAPVEELPAESSGDIVIQLTLKLIGGTPEAGEYDIQVDSDQLQDGDEDAFLHVLETLVENIKTRKLIEQSS